METCAWPRIELGYGNNVEDWAIRRSAPKDDLLVNGAGSEIAKLSVCAEGISNLSTLKGVGLISNDNNMKPGALLGRQ